VTQVHASPADIERMATIVTQSIAEIEKVSNKLRGEYKRLGTTWKDPKYRRFASDFEQSLKALSNASRALEPHPRQLRSDAANLKRYLQG
jgi:uncharacterized protein YukE